MELTILIRNIVLFIICGWISYTDLKRHEIDHTPLLIGLLFILPFNLLGFNDITFIQSLIGCVTMFALFFLLTFFGMGGGDMKLMTLIGMFLGFGRSMTVTIVAIYVSAIVGVLIMLFKRNKMTLKSKLPMGPSIAIGTIFSIYGYHLVLNWISNNIVVIGV